MNPFQISSKNMNVQLISQAIVIIDYGITLLKLIFFLAVSRVLSSLQVLKEANSRVAPLPLTPVSEDDRVHSLPVRFDLVNSPKALFSIATLRQV